ncbi:putative E3 ubiquitin-protein ligase RING1a isoform X3 [Cyprinodon tularosa]|uniref:putative E3 ubiquitin-protein ligase RING1a isoform X3 n=1 Tax=Cyprinodon tularosa TaxID=77115 RepID=UPI0018E1E7E8|nr:putative E3 ubiquitin-protein ligase RING1a isoform X3 [Cyprinodon tularosa]
MYPLQPNEDDSSEQLTAAEDIISEYKVIAMKSEDEIAGCRQELDSSRIILHRIDFPQNCVCKEEEDSTELCHQEGNSTSVKEEPEPMQIKQEQENCKYQEFKEEEKQQSICPSFCISQEEEQVVLKEETEYILVNPPYVQKNSNERNPNRDQLISHGYSEEHQDQEGNSSENQGRDKEQKQNEGGQKTEEQKGTSDSSNPNTPKISHSAENGIYI